MVSTEGINKPRILFSVPTKHHVEIAIDEMDGMMEMGYPCGQFPYSAKEGVDSKIGRLWVIIQNAFNLVKIAYQFKPDIIYINTRVEFLAGMRDAVTILILKLFYYRHVKFLIKSHGSDLDILKTPGFAAGKVIMPYLKKNVSAWLFLSAEEKTEVDNLKYFAPDSVFVTKNIVRYQQFQPDPSFKTQLSISEKQTTILFVGRLIREKGIYEVIESFVKIKDTYNAVLIIVGWGPESANLKLEISRSGINDKVIFTGFIPEPEVIKFYANCDILVFPTYFPEGFPMALFNSVAAGMCIVTTPTRAANDYLTDPDNCIWVRPRNSQGVFIAVAKLLASTHLRSQMKANNIKKGETFSKKQVCRELSEIFHLIIQHHV